MVESVEQLAIKAVKETAVKADKPRRSLWQQGQWLLARGVAWGTTTNWRITTDWSAVRPVLMRYTSHMAILALAVVALLLAGVQLPSGADAISLAAFPSNSSVRTLSSRQGGLNAFSPPASPTFTPPDDGTITRLVLPQTTIPERARATVITYTVQSGDTVFGIAEKFGLTPYTIYWANTETLEDNPHRLGVNMVLNILPVDGVYHTVSAGETVETLAEEYSVDPGALYNEWNALQEESSLVAGTHLVIPGGEREFIAWQLPQTVSSSGAGAINQGRQGICTGSYSGLPGRGWFTWPTAGRRISGWYFRDPRNPAHNGIDIGLKTGDLLYAADGGIVIFAGWWGANGYGNLVVIDHLNGWQSWYAHLSQVNVICGQQVSAGQVIGLGGSTGWSTGPHLHFEIRLEGVPYDPLAYLP